MKTQKVRLFFAMPMSQALRADIERLCLPLKQRHDANWVPGENYHITLAYIGETEIDDVEAIIEYATPRIDTGLLPIQWTINLMSHFRSGVLYLGGYNTPLNMTKIARALDFFIPIHARHPNFIPHVTIAKQAGHIVPVEFELSAQLSDVVLYESEITEQGVHYSERFRWQH